MIMAPRTATSDAIPIKVLIADSQPVFRRGLESCLAATPDLVASGSAGAGEEVPASLESDEHDVVLLDSHMPGMEGCVLLKRIKEQYPRLPVLLVVSTTDAGWLIRGIRAGAAGIVSKNASMEVFGTAIRRVHSGSPYIAEPLAERLVMYYQRNEGAPLDERLSRREFEVMQLLCRGLKVSEIARELHLSHQTIASHRRNITMKTGLRTVAESVRYGIMNGVDGVGAAPPPPALPWGRMGEG